MNKFFIYLANKARQLLHKCNKLLGRNKDTIIVAISGGLGNQLFQYAFAKLLEEKLNKNIAIDCFSKYVNEKYERTCLLLKFQIKLKIIDRPDGRFRYIKNKYKTTNLLASFIIKSKLTRDSLLYRKSLFNKKSNKIIYIDQYEDKENIINLVKEFNQTGLIYTMGYWQSAEVVNLCRHKLLADIKLAQKASNKYYELRKKISSHKNSTAIHFRQSWNIDYSKRRYSKPITAKHLQHALPLEYYKRAINLIRKDRTDTMFFIFADDTNKAAMMISKLLPKSDYHVIHRGGKETDDHEDLLLISQCQNHIMSNSTFSWWGAWLSWAKISPEANKNMYIMTNDWDTNGMKHPVTEELTFSPNIIYL